MKEKDTNTTQVKRERRTGTLGHCVSAVMTTKGLATPMIPSSASLPSCHDDVRDRHGAVSAQVGQRDVRVSTQQRALPQPSPGLSKAARSPSGGPGLPLEHGVPSGIWRGHVNGGDTLMI